MLFKARIIGKTEWEPDNEIQQVDFFHKDTLTKEIHEWNKKRINDAYENKTSIVFYKTYACLNIWRLIA